MRKILLLILPLVVLAGCNENKECECKCECESELAKLIQEEIRANDDYERSVLASERIRANFLRGKAIEAE